MTICIAAIAKEGGEEYIVFSTDHMVSTALGQFEHSIVKYKTLNGNVVAMLAGNPLLFDELVHIGDTKAGYNGMITAIFENFKRKRREILQNELLNAYGVDERFIAEALRGPIPNPHVGRILEIAAKFSLQTSILLIGFEDHRARISEINEMGMADFRDMNFHTIGSGNAQAANTLLFQRQDKCDPLLCTLYNVYKAKRNAEVLEGVGRDTELLILSTRGRTKLNEKEINILSSIYSKELRFGKDHADLSNIELKGEARACS